MALDMRKIDKNKNILIIGEGATNTKLNQIFYTENLNTTQISNLYGSCELTDAFSFARIFNIQNIFLVNIRRKTDYCNIANIIHNYDFAYIVPLGVYFSDTFFNIGTQKVVTYAELFLNATAENDSTVIMTDAHASLYEDIDSYLKDMDTKIKSFKNTCRDSLQYGNNLCLVANNLKNYTKSNLIFASVLCNAELKDYPSFNFGPAIFDIDDFDVSNELIYFKSNVNSNTSIENLKNFRLYFDAAKMVTIDKAVKYIIRGIDYTDFCGIQFNEYVKLNLYKYLSNYLQNLIGSAIRNYKINNITLVKNNDHTGSICIDFSITPINSIEEFRVVKEV